MNTSIEPNFILVGRTLPALNSKFNVKIIEICLEQLSFINYNELFRQN